MHPFVHAQSVPDKPAIIMGGSGECVSYAELDARSNQGAQLFRRLGLRRGDGVALLMENTPRFLEAVWAAQRAGLYYTCISTRLTVDEIEYIIRDAGAALILVSARLSAVAAELKRRLVDIETFATDGVLPGYRSFEAERAMFTDARIADESPGSDMLYSSGTTGRPKGIRPPLPEGPLDQTNGLTELGRSTYRMSADTVFLSPAPLYHAAPLRWCMSVHKLGGTVVLMDHFDAEEALSLIERYQVTHAQWVPTHSIRMLKLPESVRAPYDLSSLEVVFHAAAPCPVPVKQEMLAWWGPIIHEFYGGTEANGLTSIAPEEWVERPGSVGQAKWGTLRICDEAGEPVSAREQGYVFFADGQPFEYHNDPHKTAESRNRYGWTTIGDIGWIDEDGYLFLTDRKSFMIISGGVNIYPQELENLLVTHPKVADVAVVGAPHDELGEQVVAVVQPLDWERAGPPLAKELAEWLRPRIGRLKQPKRIDFERELPRHPNGKLYKRLLRDRYWATEGATNEQ